VYFSLPRARVALNVYFSLPRARVPLNVYLSLPGARVALNVCLSLPGVRVALNVCLSLPGVRVALTPQSVLIRISTGWACVGRPDFKSKSGKIGWIPASFLQPVSALDESCIDHSVDYAHFSPPVTSTVKEQGVCMSVC